MERLTEYEAVRLFIERGVAVKHDFVVNNENAPAVAEICVRLDGIPLAIELAAARVKLLPPQAILKRLDHRLLLLTAGAHDLPARQQTLRATIDWSYDLLDELQKKLFRTLSVFSGGFSLEAAEVVCGTGNPESVAIDVLDGIESILDKSLLIQEELPGGEPRFHLLETIREYGLERLGDSGEAESVRNRHARFYFEHAKEGESNLFDGDQIDWLKSLEIEYDNIRSALHRFEGSAPEEFIRLAASLWRFWRIRGLLTEGKEFLKRAVANGRDRPAPQEAKALLGLGVLTRLYGDRDESLQYLQRSLDLYEADHDSVGGLMAHLELGWTYYAEGKLSTAGKLFQTSKGEAHALGQDLLYGMAVNGMGCVARGQGEIEQAREYFEESHRIFYRLKVPREEALIVGNLGVIQYQNRNFEQAQKYFSRSIEIHEAMGDSDNLKYAYNNLAYLYFELGKYKQATKSFQQLLTVAQDTQDVCWTSSAYAGLAEIFLAKKKIAPAFEAANSAFREVEHRNSGVELGVSCRVLGEVLLARGERERARGYFERGIALLSGINEEEELKKIREGYKKTQIF